MNSTWCGYPSFLIWLCTSLSASTPRLRHVWWSLFVHIGLTAVTPESAKLCPAYLSRELLCRVLFRSELPVSALLLELRFGPVNQVF